MLKLSNKEVDLFEKGEIVESVCETKIEREVENISKVARAAFVFALLSSSMALNFKANADEHNHSHEAERYLYAGGETNGAMFGFGVDWHFSHETMEKGLDGGHLELVYFAYPNVEFFDIEEGRQVTKGAVEMLIHGSLLDISVGNLLGIDHEVFDLAMGMHTDLHVNGLNAKSSAYFHLGFEFHLTLLEKLILTGTIAPDENVWKLGVMDLFGPSLEGVDFSIGLGAINSHEFIGEDGELKQRFLMISLGVPVMDVGKNGTMNLAPEFRLDLDGGSFLLGGKFLFSFGKH